MNTVSEETTRFEVINMSTNVQAANHKSEDVRLGSKNALALLSFLFSFS